MANKVRSVEDAPDKIISQAESTIADAEEDLGSSTITSA